VKRNNPIILVTTGSLVLSAITLLAVAVNNALYPLPVWTYFALPLAVGITAFIVFYVLIKRFIHERLKILYRSIRKNKMTGQSPFEMSMTGDVIGEATRATKEWAEERNIEILELRQQDKFRREFLGNLAHELKTPVFSIQGYVLTLLEGALEDEKVNRVFLERASKAVERMTHILEDLDELTKLEVNELKLEMRPFDVRELAREVMDSLEMLAAERSIRLSFSRENSASIMVKADRSKIAQVFTNLLNNSISYGNTGGETIVRFYEVDDIVTVEISDNGLGIDPKHIPRLFERFYRVEQSRNRNEGGSGLGLAIVKHILDSHGQNISVRSTVGIGSTFTFSLDKHKGNAHALHSSRGVQIK
jgi:two-component system, OmpR family, phosphate regulon sensor histidine kinase PhoR